MPLFRKKPGYSGEWVTLPEDAGVPPGDALSPRSDQTGGVSRKPKAKKWGKMRVKEAGLRIRA